MIKIGTKKRTESAQIRVVMKRERQLRTESGREMEKKEDRNMSGLRMRGFEQNWESWRKEKRTGWEKNLVLCEKGKWNGRKELKRKQDKQ